MNTIKPVFAESGTLEVFLGIDVGSVSTNVAALDKHKNVIAESYVLTRGRPIEAIQEGMQIVKDALPVNAKVRGVGTTGSGRQLAGVVAGADIVKNEITAHAVAALHFVEGVHTIIEIGGQDSKIIILRHGVVTDFAMNTVCAAGTGSFLDRQASRLGIRIEEFGNLALRSKSPVRIAGRCAVFAESDMIHKQQIGHSLEDITKGLCQALVRNYLNNVAKGKEIRPPIVFQGGVASNVGMKQAFEEALGHEVLIPKYHKVMGAIGAAILAQDAVGEQGKTNFRGFDGVMRNYKTTGFECDGCSNRCEIVEILVEGNIVARWGSRCGKWDNVGMQDDRDAPGAAKSRPGRAHAAG
ncbi:MAG TPA: 2-hydroxyglutaryl-CoA dehydratase [Clostridia bacterium]|nr:2-hydroxyglutaryl-CoA dehydratase [Clostridia bacterium]